MRHDFMFAVYEKDKTVSTIQISNTNILYMYTIWIRFFFLPISKWWHSTIVYSWLHKWHI